MNKIELCKSFVKKTMENFDKSHDYEHANSVLLHSLVIANHLDISKDLPRDFDIELLSFAALLHDVCDHKYSDHSISEEKLFNFIKEHLGESKAKRILNIINNISYSKEAKGLRENLGSDNIYLDIISDADRLEAIGNIGIKRCEEFTLARGGKVPEDVIKHCHDKLLRLLPEGYIKTKPGKEMALPRHQTILNYVNTYS